MKDYIVYIAIFAAAFLLVSGGIFFLNSKYTNIFAFDFSPTATVQNDSKNSDKKDESEKEKTDIKQQVGVDSIPHTLSATFLDQSMGTLAPVDTVVKVEVDTTLRDSIKQLQQKIKELTEKKEIKKRFKNRFPMLAGIEVWFEIIVLPLLSC